METIIINIIIPAISLGLITSLHCVGMCGPIALSLGLGSTSKIHFISKNLTYQLGRISTYSLMGLVVGAVGFLSIGNYQRYVSIFIGVIMILMVFLPKNLTTYNHKLLYKPLLYIKTKLSRLIGRKSYDSLYTIGLLNGLLPCGPVYIALAASLVAGGMLKSMLFMAVFGLGTLPLMFLMVFMGSTISNTLRKKILNIFPFVIVLLGILFILRGMNLGIPYISPKESMLNIHTKESCH